MAIFLGRQGYVKCMLNIMSADDLAMQGARASADVVLANVNWLVYTAWEGCKPQLED